MAEPLLRDCLGTDDTLAGTEFAMGMVDTHRGILVGRSRADAPDVGLKYSFMSKCKVRPGQDSRQQFTQHCIYSPNIRLGPES
jgi:hypothetical protein